MQGWNASIVLEQWTAEEVKEHQAAASNINKEQEQARGEIASARETLEGVHITLHCITSSWRGPNTRKISSEDNFTCMNSATAMTNRPKSRSKSLARGADGSPSYLGGGHSVRPSVQYKQKGSTSSMESAHEQAKEGSIGSQPEG